MTEFYEQVKERLMRYARINTESVHIVQVFQQHLVSMI